MGVGKMNPKINTRRYEKTIKSVLIDDRENERKEYSLEQFQKFNPKIEHLPVGDYIFTGHNNVQVCVEYKTGNDFLTSINRENNHLHNQVYSMIHEFDYHFVMVEVEDLNKLCTKRYYQTGLSMSVQEINGIISDLNTVTTVLFSQTRFGAFDLMMRQVGKFIEQKPFHYKFSKKTHNTALNYLLSIHGLDSKAYDIVETLDLRTWNDLNNLTVKKLQEVDGIGKVTAMNIMAELGV